VIRNGKGKFAIFEKKGSGFFEVLGVGEGGRRGSEGSSPRAKYNNEVMYYAGLFQTSFSPTLSPTLSDYPFTELLKTRTSSARNWLDPHVVIMKIK